MKRTHRQIIPVVFGSALLLAGAAYAEHKEPYRPPDVRVIAHELEDAARRLHRRAEKTAHHPSYREERALRRLHEFEARADRFHRQVERDFRRASYTYHDYLELRDAFARARWAMPALHATGKVRRDLEQVELLMSELRVYYRPMLRGRYDRGHRDWAWRTRSRVRFRF